jgi:hypothetical protein
VDNEYSTRYLPLEDLRWLLSRYVGQYVVLETAPVAPLHYRVNESDLLVGVTIRGERIFADFAYGMSWEVNPADFHIRSRPSPRKFIQDQRKAWRPEVERLAWDPSEMRSHFQWLLHDWDHPQQEEVWR